MERKTLGIRGLASAVAALAVLAPGTALAPAAQAAPERPAAEAAEASAAQAQHPHRARVRVRGAWIRHRHLHVYGAVKCHSKHHRGRLILIAQQHGGPHVGPKPLKSRGEARVRCDGHWHKWHTRHSDRDHHHAKGRWLRGRTVHLTGTLIGPRPTHYMSAGVVPR